MLEGKYINDEIQGYYDRLPILPPQIYISLGVARSFDELPSQMNGVNYYLEEPVTIAGQDLKQLPVHIHNFDPSLAPVGKTLTKDRMEKIMNYYGRKAGLKGVRCSPHTLCHSAAVRFLRNGGDVFSLQRMLGHASLEMTRRYCELADIDVKRAHMTASPVDNFDILPIKRHTGGFSRTTAMTTRG